MLATGLLVFECAGPMGAAMVRSRGSAWHLEGGDAVKVVTTTSCGSRWSLRGEGIGWRQGAETKLVQGRFGKSAKSTEAKPEKSRWRVRSGLGFVAYGGRIG